MAAQDYYCWLEDKTFGNVEHTNIVANEEDAWLVLHRYKFN